MGKRNASLGRSVLDLDIDDSKFHSKMANDLKAAAAWTDKAGTALMKGGKAITSVGSAMTRNITLPIVAAGAAVTHFALDFDTTMRRIVGLAKVPKDEIEGVGDSIKKMAVDVGRSPQELGEAFYFVASAGFKAEEAMKVLEISAKAAAAGMGQTQDIAKVLGGVINAYGHENITAAHAGDVLTAAIQDGAAEASDFAAVIGFVVPSAAALGVSFDQVTAALSAMTQVGISADTAATNLGQVLSALQKPSVQAEKAMQGLGLSSAGLRQELKEKGLLATLRTLEERFAGNEVAAAAVFGNIRALRGVTALLGLDTEQLNGIFADTAGALGNLQQAYDDTDGPQRRLDKAMAKLEVTAIALGADVLPMVVDILNKVADAASGVSDWWDGLDQGTRDLIVSTLAWLAIAGPVLMIVGKLATGLGGVLKVIGFLAGAKGIPRLIVLLKGLRLASFGALGPFGILLGVVMTLYELLDGSDADKQFDLFAKKLGKSASHLKSDLEKAGVSAEDFAKAVDASGGDVQRTYDRMVNGAHDMALDTAAALREGGGQIEQTASDLPGVVSAAIVDGEYQVSEAAEEGMADPVAEALQKAVDDAGQKAQDMLDALAGTLAEGPQQLKDELQEIADALLHPYTDFRRRVDLETNLASKVTRDGLNSQDSRIQADTAKKIEGWLAEYELLAPGAFAAGQLVNPALQGGIDSTMATLLSYLHNEAIIPLTNAFDVADVLEAQGQTGLAGYVRGMEMVRLGAFTRELTNYQRELHKRLDESLYTSGYNVGYSYGSGLHAAGGYVADQARFLKGKVSGFLAFSGSPAYTHSREIGEGVGESWGDGIVHAMGASLHAIQSGVSSVGDALTFGPQIQMPALAGVGMEAAGSRSAAPAGAGGGMTIEGGIHIAISGVGSDVSPAASSLFGEMVMDEFTARLRDQAAQIVRIKPVGPG